MAHEDAPPLPCARAGWPNVRSQLLALAAAPPASGVALVAALAPLRAALDVHSLGDDASAGMAAFFDEPGAPQHRTAFLRNGGLAGALAAAARLQEAVRDSDAACATAPLVLLPAGVPGAASLTRDAAASLLATAFLCLMPGAAGWSFPTFCFRALWSECHYPSIAAKLDCHLHYHVSRAAATPPPPGVLRFERRVLDGVAAAAEENSRAVPLCRLLVEPRASICASHAPLRADFANASLGGGALSGGCVQEEILFSQRPELCVGLLLCEEMDADEAIVMRGAARYSATRGYAREFQWAGDAATDGEDAAPHDYVAFDALHLRERDADGQWHGTSMRRELRKALAAFAVPGGGPAPAVATGNWGCGAFHGHPPLKAMLQWAAASIACCEAMHYHAFGEDGGELATALAAAAQHVSSTWPPSARTAGGLCAAVARYAGRMQQPQPPLLTWLLSNEAREAATP